MRRNLVTSKNNTVLLLFVVFGLIFIRFCYYGLEYFPQLDDFIQYHNYMAFQKGTPSLIQNTIIHTTRPLAGIFDLYVWTPMFNHLILAVAIVSALYASASVLLYKVFNRRFGTGCIFFVIVALLPVGFEGTYWLSASSRIVVGLFFASISIYLFDRWCDGGKKSSLIFFLIFQLISFGFYEQIVLFSCAVTFIIMLCEIKPHNKRALWGFATAISVAIIFIFIKLASSGATENRMGLYFPWQENYFQSKCLPILWQMKSTFLDANIQTLTRGLLRGFKYIKSEPNIIYIIFTILLCTSFYALTSKREKTHFLPWIQIFVGIFLVIVPVLLFFILKTSWFSMRNTTISYVGIALLVDAIWGILLYPLKSARKVESALAACLALVLCIASVSELHDYKESYQLSKEVGSITKAGFEDVKFDSDDTVFVFNTIPATVQNSNFDFHEHIATVCSSDWCFTGAMRCMCNRGDISLLKPITNGSNFVADVQDIINSKLFCYHGDKLIPVTSEETGEGFILLTETGIKLAELTPVYEGYNFNMDY